MAATLTCRSSFPAWQGTISHPSDPSLKLPMGKGKPTGVARSALLYNEYVVYDTRQIRQKYVLKVQFKHR
jgi:poly [ADP-ribose] polymerase